MNYLYLILATVLFSFAISMSKWLDKRWISPAIIFIYAFYAHAFLAPVNSIDVIATYNLETFGEASALALLALLLLVFGYSIFLIRSKYGASSERFHVSESIFSGHSYLAALCLVFFALANVVDFFSGGGLEGVRGQDSYNTSGTLFGAFSLMAFPMFTAIFIGLFTEGLNFRRVAFPILLICFTVIVLISLATFGRHKVFLVVLSCATYYHFRVKEFSSKNASVAIALLVLISIFSANRRFGGSALELSLDEAIESIQLFIDDPLDSVIGVIAPLAGFEVFTQVISLVPSVEDFMYGKTYVQSFFGIFFPKFMFGDFINFETPAFWFHRIYSPYTMGHGFDFSLLSELYMNFGVPGMLLMAGLGYFVGWLGKIVTDSKNAFHIFISLYALMVLVVGLRNDSNAMFKNAAYSLLFVALLRGFLRFRPV